MKRSAAALLLAIAITGCASSGVDTAKKVNLIPPEFKVRQITGQAFAARHVSGPVTVQFAMDFRNDSSETIVLERVQLESMGEGAYDLDQISRPYSRKMLPNDVITIGFWAPAIANATIMGANGPVTIRATAYFNSPFGRFREIYIQQVNDGRQDNYIPH